MTDPVAMTLEYPWLVLAAFLLVSIPPLVGMVYLMFERPIRRYRDVERRDRL